MKKIVLGIFILIFQLIGFSNDFLGTWAIKDKGADYIVFTILKIDNKYYKATKDNNYVSVDSLTKINGRLYLQANYNETYVYSYDKAKKILIERKKEDDYYETYSKVENEDFSDCDIYLFDKDSKILEKTRKDVEYQDFLGKYLGIEIKKNEDERYCITNTYNDIYDETKLLTAKNKELATDSKSGITDIKMYFSKVTKSFVDAFNLKDIKVGDKVLTIQYNYTFGNTGEFYYIHKE